MKTKKEIIETVNGIEALEKGIEQVAQAARKILNSRLKQRTIAILIRDSIEGQKPGLLMIQNILDVAATLDFDHMKMRKKQ